jgi:hypothetical protein
LTNNDMADIVDSADWYKGIRWENQDLRDLLINIQLGKIYGT